MRLALALVSIIGIAIGLNLPIAKQSPVAAMSGLRLTPQTQAGNSATLDAMTPEETVLHREASGHFLTVANVNAEPIRFIVDTGADTVALTEEDARRAHVDFDPNQFEVVGRGAAGDVRGQRVQIASLELDGKHASDVRAVVIDGGDISLLGQTYLRNLNEVQIKGDTMTLR